MKFIVAKILALYFLTNALARNLTKSESYRARKALYNPNLFEGDILLDKSRNAIPVDSLRWTNGVIPYVIDRSLVSRRPLILSAMEHFHQRTCIKFIPRTNEANYLNIFYGQGCYSYVGMVNKGQQPLSLAIGCYTIGTVVHELNHAVGFYHEQNRSDRDDYLNIYWDNIRNGMTSQFHKLAPNANRLYNTFDYSSIMINGEYAFSKQPGVLKTMEDKHGVHRLTDPYAKPGLTASDVERINKLYSCK